MTASRFRIRLLRFWRNTARPLLFLMIVLFSFRSAIADWNDVPTGSMKPTIIEGDRIFVNKLAYDLKVPFTTWHILEWSNPKRGEIVVFYSPADGVRLVKRVVGIPGDKIEMVNNHLIINGKQAAYEPLESDTVSQMPEKERGCHGYAREISGAGSHPVADSPGIKAMRSFGPVVVPKDQYFMMGDNRDYSADSRYIGCVPRSAIVGRASRVVVSFDYDDYYLPRGARWFRKLP